MKIQPDYRKGGSIAFNLHYSSQCAALVVATRSEQLSISGFHLSRADIITRLQNSRDVELTKTYHIAHG